MLATPSLPITATWAPLFAGYSFYLMSRVVRSRMGAKVSLGDGTVEELSCLQKDETDQAKIAKYKTLRIAMRAQSNYLENVPIALFLIAVLEANRASPKAIHGLLGTLFAARVLHANFGMFWNATGMGKGRFYGFMTTNAVIIVSSVWNGVIGSQVLRGQL
ncbi:hypothetical protein INT44_001492 [Umbelopsis vinacea]|uniref:Uncharacterized protein n=1 Tax=Umbelopsis vinacea TaxID=44442 RepID=A0A8H7UE78_9FUNG|nr:hypothetical protein INT44_001492 [Umbelopsis vinacea]